MRRGTATLLVASMFLSYTALFAWRANLDLTNHLLCGVVSNVVSVHQVKTDLFVFKTDEKLEPDYIVSEASN